MVEFVDSESGEVLAKDKRGRVNIEGVIVYAEEDRRGRVNLWPVIVLAMMVVAFIIGGVVGMDFARTDAEIAGCDLDPHGTYGQP